MWSQNKIKRTPVLIYRYLQHFNTILMSMFQNFSKDNRMENVASALAFQPEWQVYLAGLKLRA